jgi:methylmalonyl-CoA/ethylmalonyl-CoA epimerase
MIAVHDMEKAKQQYSDLLGATFLDADWTGEPFGINVSIAWDAGIELCAPLPGREQDSAISQFLAQRGEGLMNVFFGVDDGDEANDRAAAQGYGCVNALDYSQEEIDLYLGGLFSRYQEVTLNSGARCGFAVTLARIDEKPRP